MMISPMIHNRAHYSQLNIKNSSQSASAAVFYQQYKYNNGGSSNSNNNDSNRLATKYRQEEELLESNRKVTTKRKNATSKLASLASQFPPNHPSTNNSDSNNNKSNRSRNIIDRATKSSSFSSSLHSCYNKYLSSVMLDISCRLHHLTNAIQKGDKTSESRLTLIDDDCYITKATTTYPIYDDDSGGNLTAKKIKLKSTALPSRHQSASKMSPTTVINNNARKLTCSTKQDADHSIYHYNKNIDQDISSSKPNKQLATHNDCQPLLKNSPRFQFCEQPEPYPYSEMDNFHQVKLQQVVLNRENSTARSKSKSCMSRIKYSIESLEYQRHLDTGATSLAQESSYLILRKNFTSPMATSTSLWAVAFHIALLVIPLIGGGDLVQCTPMNNGQVLVYSPTAVALEGAPVNMHPVSNGQSAASSPSSQSSDDYGDEGSDLDIMSGQQQISTAHLLSAAGHIIPDNYFGANSVPLAYATSSYSQSGHQMDPMHAASSDRDTVNQQASGSKHTFVESSQNSEQQQQQSENAASYIDYNGYNLATQPEHDSSNQADIVDFSHNNAAYYAIYNGDNPIPQGLQINMQNDNLVSQDSIASQVQYDHVSNNQIGGSDYGQYQSGGGRNPNQSNFGQPTRDGTKPNDLIAPNQGIPTNIISSPAINALSHLPNVNVEKLVNKIPQMPTPQFSFSSSKDPMEKVKTINQKKRTMMRQAEQLARMMIDQVNKKFGTTIGDQTDIPFVLSTLGPLGFAQNLLFDPSLLVTLLSTTEKGLMSDVMPAPAKMIIRPVLNAFRMPNKKRDKGNLINVLSYISSGLQAPSGLQSNHRQATTIKKTGARKY